MRLLCTFLCICLFVTGMASAIAADAVSPGITKAVSGVSPGIFTLSGHTGCSDDSASVGTPVEMGELDVDSIPDGASVIIDGAQWGYKHCFGNWPQMTCVNLPISTPYTGSLDTGTHTIAFSRDGYTSYSGTVEICSQRVSYVHKTLTAIPTTVTTAPSTTATTAAAATTTAAATTPAATTAPVTAGTTAEATQPVTVSTTAAGSVTTEPVGAIIPAGTGTVAATTVPPATADAAQPAATATARSPGFGAAFGLLSLGAILFLHKRTD